MKKGFMLILFIMLIFIVQSCTNEIVNDSELEKGIVFADENMKNLIKELYKEQESKIFENPEKNKDVIKDIIEEEETEYKFGIPLSSFPEYQTSGPIDKKEISVFSLKKMANIQFIGFSKNSRYLVYKVDNTYYIMDLNEKNTNRNIVFKDSNLDVIKEYLEKDLIDVWEYDKTINNYLRENYFWFKVATFKSQAKSGFYISMYGVESKKEFTIFSRKLSSIDEMKKTKKFDVFFSSNKEWLVIHSMFSYYNSDFGFVLINIRKQFAKLLREEAVDEYKKYNFETSLLKFRQSIYLDPEYSKIESVYYDCAVLMKKLNKSGYSLFVEKAISLNSQKYKKKAVEDGLINN